MHGYAINMVSYIFFIIGEYKCVNVCCNKCSNVIVVMFVVVKCNYNPIRAMLPIMLGVCAVRCGYH